MEALALTVQVLPSLHRWVGAGPVPHALQAEALALTVPVLPFSYRSVGTGPEPHALQAWVRRGYCSQSTQRV